jgi:hypothetical protein
MNYGTTLLIAATVTAALLCCGCDARASEDEKAASATRRAAEALFSGIAKPDERASIGRIIRVFESNRHELEAVVRLFQEDPALERIERRVRRPVVLSTGRSEQFTYLDDAARKLLMHPELPDVIFRTVSSDGRLQLFFVYDRRGRAFSRGEAAGLTYGAGSGSTFVQDLRSDDDVSKALKSSGRGIVYQRLGGDWSAYRSSE